MVKGSHKGGTWERECARILSEWLTGSRNPPVLWRSTSSGGWAYRDIADVADLAPSGDNEAGLEFRRHFGVECKHWAEIDWWHTWSSQSVQRWYYECWIKTVDEVRPHGLEPLLMMKQNHRPVLVAVRPQLYRPPLTQPHAIVVEEGHEACFFELDHWLQLDPKDLYRRCNDLRS